MNRRHYQEAGGTDPASVRLLNYDLEPFDATFDAAQVWILIEEGAQPGELLWDRDVFHNTIYNGYQFGVILDQARKRDSRWRPSAKHLEAFNDMGAALSRAHGYVWVMRNSPIAPEGSSA